MGAEVFQAMAQNEDTELGSFSLHELDKFIQDRTEERPPDLDKKALRKAALEVLPPKYHNFIDIFSKAKSDKLSSLVEGRWHNINFKDAAKTNPEALGFPPLYKLTLEEMEEARRYVVENLAKGFIEPSAAAWAAPILFVRKANGKLRLCVDYRRLNAMTERD